MDPAATFVIAQSDPSPWLWVGVIGGFFIVFPAFWCGIICLLSYISGWNRLAKSYAAGDREPSGVRRSSVSGRIGGVNYNSVLTLHVAEDGFFLQPIFLFAVGHPRLFIPWSAMSDCRTGSFLWWTTTTIDVGHPKIASITLRVPAELFRRPA